MLRDAHAHTLRLRFSQESRGNAFRNRLEQAMLRAFHHLANQLEAPHVIERVFEPVALARDAQVETDLHIHIDSGAELALGREVTVMAEELHAFEHKPIGVTHPVDCRDGPVPVRSTSP